MTFGVRKFKSIISRSREGAWIEISPFSDNMNVFLSRSREGAWIEMRSRRLRLMKQLCRSREGAWIEIGGSCYQAPPAMSRSREGAWIEIIQIASLAVNINVAPARERGLKCLFLQPIKKPPLSLPRGSVD